MPAISRTWSIPTSPRSPYKLGPELKLLSSLEGEKWNKQTQVLFATKLAESDFYEGKIPRNLDFAARDRINRSPRTLGFVEFPGRKIKITKAGRQLISGERLEELFTRQLLKWQYPSPKHNGTKYPGFNIKPFLEILRLAYELDGLSKREIAIFFLPLINYENYSTTKENIVNFRAQLSQLRGVNKKRFVKQQHLDAYKEVFREELDEEILYVRENGGQPVDEATFLKTKIRTSTDYADSAIRYFRATGLFKLSATTFRLQIIESKKKIAEEILRIIPRQPSDFTSDPENFLNFIGDPVLPLLPDDRPEVLQEEVGLLMSEISSRATLSSLDVGVYRTEQLVSASTTDLKNLRDQLEGILKKNSQDSQIRALQSYSLYDDVLEMYDKIVSRTDYDIPDKPLFFEWNTWRAFAMLNDGDVTCNAKLDRDSRPLSTAPGGGADSICYYSRFATAVEVTLSRGARQFEAEHESVPRHLGKLIKTLRENGDSRPAFGIFIASGLNQATIANFYTIRRMNVEQYGGKARVIPLDLKDFKKMLEVAKNTGGVRSDQLLDFLDWADKEADRAENEIVWYESIRQQIPNWLSVVR